MKTWQMIVSASLCLSVATLGGCHRSEAGQKIKIGFIVKQPQDPWFQREIKFAKQAGDDKGFEVVALGATNGQEALSALDTMAGQGVKGVVICVPDAKLGPGLVAKAKADDLKLMAVDDQFIGADGAPMTGVHYVGIAAADIGRTAGQDLYDQMKARGWTPADTAVCVVTFDQLQTTRDRTDGEVEALTKAGFPADKIFKMPETTQDLSAAIDAGNNALGQHPDVKHWLACGINDNAVLGFVRATEGRGIPASDVCGIGINGTDVVSEFEKAKPTGLYGSMLLLAKKHGYDTTSMMYAWVKDGKEPPMKTLTQGVLITRETYKQVMKDQGSAD